MSGVVVKVNGPVPPVKVTTIWPSLMPKLASVVLGVAVIDGQALLTTNPVCISVHAPDGSVTINV